MTKKMSLSGLRMSRRGTAHSEMETRKLMEGEARQREEAEMELDQLSSESEEEELVESHKLNAFAEWEEYVHGTADEEMRARLLLRDNVKIFRHLSLRERGKKYSMTQHELYGIRTYGNEPGHALFTRHVRVMARKRHEQRVGRWGTKLWRYRNMNSVRERVISL